MRIHALCTAEQIRRSSFDCQFGRHAQYKSLYTRRESLEEIAAEPEANVALALAPGEHIVGFGVLTCPRPDERWSELGPCAMMEIKAIEVARDWRSNRLAHAMVDALLRHPAAEERIFYMVGYSWTWDLDGTGKSAQEYRQMLIHLFEPHGFQEYQTNEPNICLKPENLFMGRVGGAVDEATLTNFKWLRFGVSP